MITDPKKSLNQERNQDLLQAYPSFDDYLEASIVTGMTKGQIYLFSKVSAQIFTCWMLIVRLANHDFFWPVLAAEVEELAIDTAQWYKLALDERLSLTCSEAYQFQIPFRYARAILASCNGNNLQDVEFQLRITLEHLGIKMTSAPFGEENVGRLLVVDDDMPLLVIGKHVYIADIDPLARSGFIDWKHHSVYKWRRTDSRNVVQLVPTLAIELDDAGQVGERWLGQEILAEWQTFSKETSNGKQYGIRAEIGDLHLVHYNIKRTQIRHWQEFRN